MAADPFTMELNPLSDELKALAEKELRETPETVQKSCDELRELLKNDPTIHFPDDEEFLLIYLRPCKFYAKSAYEMMKRIAEFKEKNKHLLADLLPSDEKVAFTDHNLVNIMKDRDHKGRRVLIVNCGGSWDPFIVSPEQLFRMFYLIHEAVVLEPETQVRGTVVLMDFDLLGRKQVSAFSPAFSMRLLEFIQDAMPLRLKEIHIVKQPIIYSLIWHNNFKFFVKEKLKSRWFTHGSNMSSLHTHLAPSHLPKNYGGVLPEINYTGANWYSALENLIDPIKKMNTCGYVKE